MKPHAKFIAQNANAFFGEFYVIRIKNLYTSNSCYVALVDCMVFNVWKVRRADRQQ